MATKTTKKSIKKDGAVYGVKSVTMSHTFSDGKTRFTATTKTGKTMTLDGSEIAMSALFSGFNFPDSLATSLACVSALAAEKIEEAKTKKSKK